MKALFLDTLESAQCWRKWHLFGMQTVRAAYARSRIGQFWITLLFLIFVVSIGTIYTTLWQVRPADFLPFFALSWMLWSLLSTIVLESSSTYIAHAPYLKAERQPKTLFVFAIIYKNLIVMAHNFVVVIAVFLAFGKPITTQALLVVPGLVIFTANCFWIAMVNALFSARFRDIPAVVSAVVQIAFFVSPIMWPPSAIANPNLRLLLVDLNPVANLIAIVRDPILGQTASPGNWGYSIVMMLIGLCVAGFIFAKSHRRLVYWI